MSEPNPYQPTQPPVAPGVPAVAFSSTGRSVDAGRGWEWIAEGFALFKKQPGIWILIVIAFAACSIVVTLVPVIGALANLLLVQVFMGGLMLGARALDHGEELQIGHLFAGFSSHTGDLVVLGLLAMVGWLIALIPAIVIMGGGAFMAMLVGGSSATAGAGALGLSFVLAMLSALALAVPLYMAVWFAPALIVFNNMKPVEAMKTSFFGSLKNIVPFLLYGVVLVVLCLVAAIPLMLGYLVLGPVIIASIYTGYRDIFTAD